MERPIAKPAHPYHWLDLLRGAAAMEVFLAHGRTLFFADMSVGKPSVWKSILYYASGFSHQAVMIFFVLSGFLISGSIRKAALNGKFNVRNYSIDRLVRLWIVLIPALLITLLADRSGMNQFHASPLYSGLLGSTQNSATTFFGNVFFLQNFLVPPFGTNSPLWSICNEGWYYILFPLLYFACFIRPIWIKIMLIVVPVILMFFIGLDITRYFLIWCLGFGVLLLQEARSVHRFIPVRYLFMPALTGILLLINYTRRGGTLSYGYDLGFAMLTALLVFCGINTEMRSKRLRMIASFFSRISYSLYAVHFPLLIFSAAWLAMNRAPLTLHSFLIYAGTMLVILLISVACWFLFESRYRQVREYCKRRFQFN